MASVIHYSFYMVGNGYSYMYIFVCSACSVLMCSCTFGMHRQGFIQRVGNPRISATICYFTVCEKMYLKVIFELAIGRARPPLPLPPGISYVAPSIVSLLWQNIHVYPYKTLDICTCPHVHVYAWSVIHAWVHTCV